MNVPLRVQPDFHGATTMTLQILADGRWQEQSIPFRPYCYSRPELSGPTRSEIVHRRILSTRKEERLWKNEFDTTLPVAQLNDKYEPKKGAPRMGPAVVLESHVRFPERVGIDDPDFYLRFPHRGDLKVLTLDTEGLTRHGKYLGRHFIGMLDHQDEVFQVDLEDAKQVARELARHDVVTGFNIGGYDWPWIERFAARAGVTLPSTFLSYDVSRSAQSDQTLHGIKDRGLKAVARWYGLHVTEVDGRNTADVPIRELMSYNVSDLWATRALFDIYFPRLAAIAEYARLPVEMVTEEIPSTVPSIVFARGLRSLRIVSDGTNLDRHPEIRGKVQGAYTYFTDPGLYRNVHKPDFKQMYPSIILELNLGPDTTWIVGFEPLGEFVVEPKGDHVLYHVPDANIGQNVLVYVDMTHRGVVAEFLNEIGILRDRVKAQMKHLSEGEKEHSPLHAIENAYKILRNTVYGYTLSKKARFADLATGLLVACIGRQMIQRIQVRLQERWGRLAVLEVDTDGIYAQTGGSYASPEELGRYVDEVLQEWCREYLGRTAPGFVIDHLDFPAAFFSKTKNYVLLDDRGNVILKGGSMKGRRKPIMFDRALADILPKIFANEPVNARPYYKWDRYAPEDFLMRVSLGKPMHEFENDSISLQIAQQYRARGEPVEVGTIMEYYESMTGHRAYFREDPFEPDYGYYSEKVLDKLFHRFGIPLHPPTTIDGVMEFVDARLDRARKRGQYETCGVCRGLGWYLPRGKVVPVDCTSCEAGRRLVVS